MLPLPELILPRLLVNLMNLAFVGMVLATAIAIDVFLAPPQLTAQASLLFSVIFDFAELRVLSLDPPGMQPAAALAQSPPLIAMAVPPLMALIVFRVFPMVLLATPMCMCIELRSFVGRLFRP